MKIRNSELRRVIRSVISESHEDMMSPVAMPAMHGGQSHDFMQKAKACVGMEKGRLFDMCAQICDSNPSMARHCADLCKCVCNGDMEECCRCLGEICSCPQCAQICADCCRC